MTLIRGAAPLALLLAATVAASAARAQEDPPSGLRFERETLALAEPVDGLTAFDVDGDGKLELLVAHEEGIDIVPLHTAQSGTAPLARIERGSARTLAWCVAGSAGGRAQLWLLRDEGAVQRFEWGVGPVDVLKSPGLLLPRGVVSFPFARDLDSDGRVDLTLPDLVGLKLFFGQADGTFAKGPAVHHRLAVDLDLPAPGSLSPDVGAGLSVPAFDVEDQNADGHPDLAFRSGDQMQFFWSGKNGMLPELPTFEVDLDALKEKLAAQDEDLLDPSNLFKLLKNQVSARVRDLDGDGRADLLVRQGPKVSLFAGTEGGVDRSKPVQVLKTSGNLLAAFTADDDGNGTLDLCMLQVADVSIGEALLWLVAGGSLKLDIYTYFQEGKLRFARTPSRKRRLVIDVPAILAMGDEVADNASFKQLEEQLARLPVALDLDGDGRRTDVALLGKDGRISLFRNATEQVSAQGVLFDEEETWRYVLERFDRLAKGESELTIELLDVVHWIPIPGGRLRDGIEGKVPTELVGDADPAADPSNGNRAATGRVLVVLDTDGDRKDDLLLLDPGPIGGWLHVEVFRTR